MHKASYGKIELEQVFVEIGEKLGEPLTVFMFGGGAMVFRNQKLATKDLDVVFENAWFSKKFATALEPCGFHKVKILEKPYEDMAASGIWEKADKFRIDLFVKTVCNALEITPSIVKRSEVLGAFGKLTVKMFSNEDIVLFKGITQRSADVDDIAVIVTSLGPNMNWDVVLQESVLQSEKRPWHGPLLDKLREIDKNYKITAPIIDQLQELYYVAFLLQYYKMKKEEGKTHEEIIAIIKAEGATEKELKQLERDLKKGKIELR